jgi:nitrate reductase gamma subunit
LNQGSLLLYVVLPYAAIATFILGHIWRYRRDQYRWGARSSQLLESRVLMWGSTIFHFGVLAAIAGHVLGVAVPISWTRAVGLHDDPYHVLAVIGGVSAGTATIVGFAILVYRRARFARIRVTTKRIDIIAMGLLAVGIVTGMWATLANISEAVHYRENVAPYFRSLFILDPRPELMTRAEGVTLIFQVHVVAVWFLYAAWPFSRLVHAWSIPIDWFRRSPIPYRSQRRRRRSQGRPAPARAATVSRSEAGR